MKHYIEHSAIKGGGLVVPSEKILQHKKEVVQQLTENIKSAKSIVFAIIEVLLLSRIPSLEMSLEKLE